MKAETTKMATMTVRELREMLRLIIKNEYGFEAQELSFPNNDRGDEETAVIAMSRWDLAPTNKFCPTGPAPKPEK